MSDPDEPVGSPGAARDVLAKRLRKQAASCRSLGSPLYAHLLTEAASDVERSGPTLAVMEAHAFDPPGAAVALRLMGSVHRVVLEGTAPELAAFYPSVGGDEGPADAWPAFRALLEDRRTDLRAGMDRPVQTNEVGRSAALLGGFLAASTRFGPRLRVLEIGASAGLNLQWDRFHYAAGASTWGDPGSPVRLDGFASPAPPLDAGAEVVARAGCDERPVDPTTEEGRLTLSSYVWPDQERRRGQLRGALELAAAHPVPIERSPASEWLRRSLDPEPGLTTVVFHSIVTQYMAEAERRAVTDQIEEAGDAASERAPVAWLRMEPPPDGTEDPLAHVYLTLWPGGGTRLVARSGYHGRPVHWLG